MIIDDTIHEWPAIADRDWSALLTGNGASRSVWPRFGYESLFRVARDEMEPGLSDDDTSLFSALELGANFERVLGSLRIAQRIGTALHLDTEVLHERYASIRQALVDAVEHVHVRHSDIGIENLQYIRQELDRYEHIFTTNYDLLPYWAAMVDPPSEAGWSHSLVDFFWNEDCTFNGANAELWQGRAGLYYLHGGLHLRSTFSAETRKAVADGLYGLLEVIAVDEPDDWPLFVSEGTSAEKLETIRSSDYLLHCYRALAGLTASLVVFGHSLASEDKHLLDAINHNQGRRVAVSLYQPHDRTAAMYELKAKLPSHDLVFFDAETHPLGSKVLMADLGSVPLA